MNVFQFVKQKRIVLRYKKNNNNARITTAKTNIPIKEYHRLLNNMRGGYNVSSNINLRVKTITK